MTNEAFESLNLDGPAPLLLICDHASNHVPAELNNLGLTPQQLSQHVGWDIGAAALTREISKSMDAAAVLSGTSRLVIDANRQPGDATGIPEISDGITITGNQNLSEADQIARTEAYFWPYHHAVADAIAHLRRRETTPQNIPAIFSIHTYTPEVSATDAPARPWQAGVLWNRDPRIAEPLIHLLRTHPDNFVIGDNEPYSGKEVYYSVDFHAGAAGLPHGAIEIRQDLVSSEKGVTYWARIISEILSEILATEELHEIRHY
ncbi:MAG: N-formylglutamate amidohydrolase [Rhodospirillaceae bacterium]|jgi:predicted N-formylglutamate amidohydrolase|nr:N-formylglutamate amidohydrolase [Rhodospirillaceae bacterium]MBT4590277.1 N-formylglutamate amidohydrolase [Rhodospirillaceae bacterium]MBT5940701.1 N-formylglutamate amidohydrolase [Rhodospirillaceae bacterium]MBT7265935.1 N-formylglutamate amidohydrolase [Rhodospirillaceae bacterium]